MLINQLPLNAIRPYENNPRKNDKAVETVARSLEQYGFQQPIVVDKNNIIVVGHTRYRAAKQLNLSTVPVLVAADLTDEQIKAYRIMDNKSNENSHWDDNKLFDELKELLGEEGNIQDLSYSSGFTESELNRMFRDEDELLDKVRDKLNPPTFSKPGDIWTLGDHMIANGDSTDLTQMTALMGKETIDLLWEDPPYGVAYVSPNGINNSEEYNKLNDHHIANDDLSPEQLDQFLTAHMETVDKFLRPGAVVYWAHDIKFTQQFRDILIARKIHISDTLIWRKNTHSNWLCDYAKYYEPVLYGWKEGAEHYWHGQLQKNAYTLDELEGKTNEQLIKIIRDFHTNYQEFSRETRKIASLHPTVKPVKLIVYHILNSSRTNDIIFDGFSGSGSTLIAAERTGRRARCIELESKFVDVTIRRWQEETGLQAVNQDGELWDDLVLNHKIDDQAEAVNANLSTLLNLPESIDGTI